MGRLSRGLLPGYAVVTVTLGPAMRCPTAWGSTPGFTTKTRAEAVAAAKRGVALGRAGTPPAAPIAVNDAIVSYDWVHGTWLVTSTAEFANGSRTLQVHRSNDGVHWSAPGEVARGMIDHPWLACDRGATSSFRCRCYVAFARQDQQRLGVRWTTDGGATWSAETAIPSALGQPTAAFPVVRPDGRLVIVWVSIVRTSVTSLERRDTSSPTRLAA